MNLKQLVDKVMGNGPFYQALKKDAVEALRKEGVELKPEQVEALKKINWTVLDEIARVFGYRVT